MLAGKMAAEVKGVQKNAMKVSVKHFALNNSENLRFMGDSVFDMRGIRELYLKPVEIIVKESKPQTLMCAYNKINGDLQPGETVVIEYEIKAHKPIATPVTHFANLQFTVNDPVRGSVNYSENTDTLSVNVLYEKNDKAAKTVIYNPDGSGLSYCCQACCGCCRNCCRCCCDCLSYYDLCNFYGGFYC